MPAPDAAAVGAAAAPLRRSTRTAKKAPAPLAAGAEEQEQEVTVVEDNTPPRRSARTKLPAAPYAVDVDGVEALAKRKGNVYMMHGGAAKADFFAHKRGALAGTFELFEFMLKRALPRHLKGAIREGAVLVVGAEGFPVTLVTRNGRNASPTLLTQADFAFDPAVHTALLARAAGQVTASTHFLFWRANKPGHFIVELV